MKKLSLLLVSTIVFASLGFAQNDRLLAQNPEVITGQLIRITKPLSQLTPADKLIPDVPVRDENGRIWEPGKKPAPFVPSYFPAQDAVPDASLQNTYASNAQTLNRAITANFAGLGYTSVNPPDPSLCAGSNHVIQMINASSGAIFKVFDKAGGQVVAQTFLDAITGRGGLGDPIALYDQFADRYVLTEFANASENGNQEGLIFAVSQTNNPAGSWYVYFFANGSIFPDYPKFSIWTDAIYGTTNDFTASYVGSTAYAFDKTKMYAGDASATVQKFSLGNSNKAFSTCPVLLQGSTTPPAGTGGLIAYMQDDSWTASTADVDSVGLLEFRVNFTTPSASALLARSSLAVTAYKSTVCTATRGQCVPMPGTTSRLESLQGRLMNQPVYRRFGAYEGLVLNHTVDKSTAGISAVRWYELRNTGGGWFVNQQSTYSPDDTHRWMGSVCYDKFGNIGLAYNVSSGTVNPGARYTGRKVCDPLNQMTYVEESIIEGTSRNGSTRYGDYNHLVADPDGVRFWFTCEYNAATTWSTRVAAFTLDECVATGCAAPTGLASGSIITSGATVSWAAVSGASSYDVDYKLPSATTWTNAAAAISGTSVAIGGLAAGTVYDWRVRANCAGGSSTYAQASFTTAANTCVAPTGLSASAITTSSATVSWAAVSGVGAYLVDYKAASSATWIRAATATTTTSVSITGLTAGTLYDWRVQSICATTSSQFAQAQFTTAAAGCATAFEPNESTAAAATISLGAANQAAITTSTDNDYFRITTTTTSNNTFSLAGPGGVDFDMNIFNSAGTQIGSGTGSTATETLTLSSQPAGTYFIRIFGYNGATSASCYTITATAASITGCASSLDNSTNGTAPGAATIPFNTNVTGLISPTGDVDFYRFVITTGGTATITLSTLPADYDVQLISSDGTTQLAISQAGGTSSETISRTYTPGTYFVRVYGYNGANNATTCYTLRVAPGTATTREDAITGTGKQTVNLFPNPAKNNLNVWVSGYTGRSIVQVADLFGRQLIQQVVTDGQNQLNVSELPQGVYILRVLNNATEVKTIKFVKE
jgi:hypothetical protein